MRLTSIVNVARKKKKKLAAHKRETSQRSIGVNPAAYPLIPLILNRTCALAQSIRRLFL